MIVKNLTHNTTVAQNCKHATTLLELVFGLHWLSNPPELLFKTRYGIHTLLLKKPIDVLILNTKYEVIAIKPGLKPNSFYFWNPKYPWVLELPEGTIEKSKIILKDQLSFDPKLKS